MDTNYFVCTLGQAAKLADGRPFRNVSHLVDQQATAFPDRPAVGFYTPSSKNKSDWQHHVINFAAVRQLSLVVAELIKDHVELVADQTVSLLSDSSPEFLFTWLALIRLGHPVLLIAPQCSPSAIAHLSKTCDATILFHDDAHQDLTERAVSTADGLGFPKLRTQLLQLADDGGVLNLLNRQPTIDFESTNCPDSQIAYLHHSSGTSTGIPKPIPQSHRAAVGVLPALQGYKHATFTTTPLYHGGVADLFRAWASSALIWLFPSQHIPVTASNITKCLSISEAVSKNDHLPSIKYFSAVPYILQMMAEDKTGLQYLQNMDIVGVGGAALPAEVGNKLVEQGVNLISRFGSAECGFLMSSHRNYQDDHDWQFLRHDNDIPELSFEAQSDGLSELVILDGWPHMAKRNRDDRSFATADLFEPHDTTPHTWKYHSRADSQLTLITGKKFDPAPLEGSIAAASSLVADVLIFGNGKPYPGALLFRSETASTCTNTELLQEMCSIIEKLNIESQGHARIPRNMLVPMAFNDSPLQKSSKGTVLRGIAEERYSNQIESAYMKTTNIKTGDVSDKELPNAILEIVKSVLGVGHDTDADVAMDTDLFSHGVDSVACVQIRHAIRQLIPDSTVSIPLTIVEDCGTVSKLSDMVIQLRHGEESVKQEDQRELLTKLVEKYSNFEGIAAPIDGKNPSDYSHEQLNILLTGPTGSLGSHILHQLSINTRIKKIYLLVRGATPHAARERVMKALSQRQLVIPPQYQDKLIVLPCKLSEDRLGLSVTDYKLLTEEIDIIFHLAWSVNFLMTLQSFASTHLAGLQNLLNLALSTRHALPPQVLFCSSVASTSNLLLNHPISPKQANKPTIPERIVHDISAAGPTGYALSKLAAELICANCSQKTSLRNRITVLRVGQLSGDTTNGVWSKSEAYPLILSSRKATNVIPDLGEDEKLAWLPVNVAARGFIEAALGPNTSENTKPTSDLDLDQVRVLHLLNPSTKTTWSDFIKHIQESGEEINIVSPQNWLNQLEKLQHDDKTKDHPALKLLSFWRTAYGGRSKDTTVNGKTTLDGVEHESTGQDPGGEQEEQFVYEMARSLEAMPSIKPYIGGLEKGYLLRLWKWINENVE